MNPTDSTGGPGAAGARAPAAPDRILFIEQLARDGSVAARSAVRQVPFTIGRAYDNDLILDDPHVAPHHLRIEREADGTLVARDLSTHNGLLALAPSGRHARAVGRLALDDDVLARIGHTVLRTRASDHPVPAERPAAREGLLERPVTAAVALFGVLLVALYEAWLAAEGPRDSDGLFSLPLTVGGTVTLWGGAWALLSRLFTHRARFAAHLTIGATGLLAIEGAGMVIGTAAFALGSSLLAGYAFVPLFGAVGAIVYAHLALIQPGHAVRSALAAGLVGLLAAGVPAVRHVQQHGSAAEPTFLSDFSWPALRLRHAVSEDGFFAAAQKLQAEVDQGRADIGADAAEPADE